MSTETRANQETQAVDWLERARAIAPIVEAHRDQGERERRLAGPVYDALREAGFFRMWLPKAFGGLEAGEVAIVQAVEEVSRHDASAGWNLAIGAETGAIWAYLPESASKRLLSDNPAGIIAGSAHPGDSRAETVSGGYRVSGRWSFASGCHQADWFIGGAIIHDNGEMRLAPEGSPDLRLFLMPKDSYEIIDTWHTTGLRGTGSNDIAANDVFVSEDCYLIPYGPQAKAFQPGALYRAPLAHIFGFAFAAVALGIARDAIDSYRQLAAAKTPTGGRTTLQAQHTNHMRVGQAEGSLRAGRELLYATVRETDEALRDKGGLDEDLVASGMLARAQAVSCAVDAVTLILDSAGTSSVLEGTRLERCSRDIRMVPRHFYVAPTILEMVGQYLLGGRLEMRR
jgi:indole-3-acetate monooxygenase